MVEDRIFEDTILAFSKNLKDSDKVSTELQAQFFKQGKSRNCLPKGSPNEVIDAFLASLVAIIGFNEGNAQAITAMEILFKHVKNDD